MHGDQIYGTFQATSKSMNPDGYCHTIYPYSELRIGEMSLGKWDGNVTDYYRDGLIANLVYQVGDLKSQNFVERPQDAFFGDGYPLDDQAHSNNSRIQVLRVATLSGSLQPLTRSWQSQSLDPVSFWLQHSPTSSRNIMFRRMSQTSIN